MEPYKFPTPPTYQDFETLIERLTKDRHPDATVQRFGRSGQVQDGVDVLITRRDGTADGYQCKHVKSLGEATVLSEAQKASKFPGGLSRFIIYSTTPRDTEDQIAARKASKKHPFLVVVSSWDDIAVDMMNNLEASQQYMSQLPLHSLSDSYMEQLRVAFDRPAFVHSAAHELSVQEQLQAIKDVQEFLSTGQLNTRDARFVLRSLPASSVPGLRLQMAEIRKLLRVLRNEVTAAAKAERTAHRQRDVNFAGGQFDDGIDTARVALMRYTSAVLANHGVAPIYFDAPQ
ncbi:hypothetical protein [Rhodococcus sp. 008]|uniref:hypothetical protein n=1 Tax=Rhodococcus sp. 008 TaxID=1723645 RepID=UPI0008063B5C|nr:hypothetical protein [Rhodococcus sp. 008]ANQ74403.1 hypothetical protein AOT96_28985 [Rhodococcus sp. 008]